MSNNRFKEIAKQLHKKYEHYPKHPRLDWASWYCYALDEVAGKNITTARLNEWNAQYQLSNPDGVPDDIQDDSKYIYKLLTIKQINKKYNFKIKLKEYT